MVLKSNPSIILLCSFLPSDYIIEEKTAVLQKREHEGFGFVLRGAKGKGCFFHLVLGLGGEAPWLCRSLVPGALLLLAVLALHAASPGALVQQGLFWGSLLPCLMPRPWRGSACPRTSCRSRIPL